MATIAARQAARPESIAAPEVSRRLAARATSMVEESTDPALGRLDSALAAAERRARLEPLLPWWRRDPEGLASAWQEVESAAAQLAREQRQRLSSLLRRWPEVERSAAAALAQARSDSLAPGNNRRSLATDVARASANLMRARGLVAAGRVAEGVELAEGSRRLSDEAHELWAAGQARFEDPAELRFWRSLVETAFREARDGRHHVIVDKQARRLEVFAGARRLAAFEVELGSNGLAQKVHAGDRTTPEGRYRVIDRRGPGQTRYHRALMLDYPNSSDRRRWEEARRAGLVPRGAGPGSLIEIHGEGGRGVDWTDGCLALSNVEMDRLFALVPLGAPVTIVGTYDRASLGS